MYRSFYMFYLSAAILESFAFMYLAEETALSFLEGKSYRKLNLTCYVVIPDFVYASI
ncbi:hypothetical protein GCM10027443_33500 [Pontibacter brevis]